MVNSPERTPAPSRPKVSSAGLRVKPADQQVSHGHSRISDTVKGSNMKIAAHVRPTDSATNSKVIHLGEALGAEFSTRAKPVKDSDLVITAGFQITRANADAMRRGIPIIVLENPVWHEGHKSDTYTWAYNGLHGGGFVPDASDCVPRVHPTLQPWKEWESGDITIFGQVPTDKAVRGADLPAWIESARAVLPNATFREHPVCVPSKYWPDMERFEDCLVRTSLAVTFTSTVGSETVIQGIPTIACHSGSLAYPVASHSLSDTPVAPCRAAWIHELSYRHQYIGQEPTLDYILSGYDEARALSEAGEYDNMSNGREQGPNYVTD